MDELDSITPDKLDAILRDPQAPDSLRALVRTLVEAHAYLSNVTFHEDENGYVTVRPKSDVEATAEPVP